MKVPSGLMALFVFRVILPGGTHFLYHALVARVKLSTSSADRGKVSASASAAAWRAFFAPGIGMTLPCSINQRRCRANREANPPPCESLTTEHIKAIFTHPPVDVTFVDEGNDVCFFSSEKERIIESRPDMLADASTVDRWAVRRRIAQTTRIIEKDGYPFRLIPNRHASFFKFTCKTP